MSRPARGGPSDQPLAALGAGPMTEEELAWMRRVGAHVRDKEGLRGGAMNVADRAVNLLSGFGFRRTPDLPRE